ncbi:MAG: hypothetical protein HY433_02345 [Candidatus Liptonbacteria bacterium]|nr:hypothetical protein [Candidatus Liptonbacteria bacterium]
MKRAEQSRTDRDKNLILALMHVIINSAMKTKNNALEFNQVRISLPAFMELYNKSIPVSFPRASVKILKQFQSLHPVLFRNNGQWSIDRHRKRVMDWLPSFCGIL